MTDAERQEIIRRTGKGEELSPDWDACSSRRSGASMSWSITAAERAAWEPLLATDADAVEDLLWALLNSREFSFNH